MTYGLDDTVPFGMFKGMTIKEVVTAGPRGKSWLAWACKNASNFALEEEVNVFIKSGKLPKKPEQPKELDFWQKIILNGVIKDVPF